MHAHVSFATSLSRQIFFFRCKQSDWLIFGWRMDEVQYLTEWPPKDDHAHRGSTTDSRRTLSSDLPGPASKRPRLGTGTATEGKLSNEERELAESEACQSAGAVLARWWKLKSRKPSVLTLERQKLIPVSSNPHTLLHHIGRCGFLVSFPAPRSRLRLAYSIPPQLYALTVGLGARLMADTVCCIITFEYA